MVITNDWNCRKKKVVEQFRSEICEDVNFNVKKMTEEKLIFVGDSGVGKTCMIRRIIDDVYEEGGKSTVSGEHHLRTYSNENCQVKLNYWDTAGQEQYQSLAPMYYREADIAVIAFSTTEPSSFDSLQDRISNVKDYTGKDTKIIIVATKIDSSESDKDQIKRGENFAKDIDACFFAVSSKTGENISKLENKIQSIAFECAKYKVELPKPIDATGGNKCC